MHAVMPSGENHCYDSASKQIKCSYILADLNHLTMLWILQKLVGCINLFDGISSVNRTVN